MTDIEIPRKKVKGVMDPALNKSLLALGMVAEGTIA